MTPSVNPDDLPRQMHTRPARLTGRFWSGWLNDWRGWVATSGLVVLLAGGWYYTSQRVPISGAGPEPTNEEVRQAHRAYNECADLWSKDTSQPYPCGDLGKKVDELAKRLDPAYYAALSRRADDLYKDWRAQAESLAVKLIESWKRGRSGSEYWADDKKPVQLYAVRGYERLGCTGRIQVMCRFRIESSTKAGFPIINIWNVELDISASAIGSPGNKLGYVVLRVAEGQ